MKLLIEVVDSFRLPGSGRRKLRGRPCVYSQKVIVKCFLVMVSYRLTSVRSLARFLEQHSEIAKACGLEQRIPSYRTLTRRFKTLDSVVISFARQVLQVLVECQVIDLKVIATDSTLLGAKGRKTQKRKPEIKPSDPDARWGWSETKGWVFGYKLHLTSTVLGNKKKNRKTIVPLCWRVTSANRHDTTQLIPLMEGVTFLANISNQKIDISLADKGYDYNKNYRWCEERTIDLITPVRRFKNRQENPLKEKVKKFVDSPTGKRLYQRRGDTERLFGQLKDIFSVDPLPVMGKENVVPYLNLANLVYLLGVLYNHLNGRSVRAIKSLVA